MITLKTLRLSRLLKLLELKDSLSGMYALQEKAKVSHLERSNRQNIKSHERLLDKACVSQISSITLENLRSVLSAISTKAKNGNEIIYGRSVNEALF